MFMFALIQNSVDIREINRLLEHIYIMLNFEYIDNKLMNSINFIFHLMAVYCQKMKKSDHMALTNKLVTDIY